VVVIEIIMGYDCNVQCDYCTITREMRSRNLTTAAIQQALEEGRRDGLTDLAFGGGEPTLRKDLVKLVHLARKLGYETIKISSNGLMYAYPDYVAALLDAGATQFNLAIMGWNRRMYESIMGQQRFFDLVVEGVGRLMERQAQVVADIIMKNDTWQELPETVQFWGELGIPKHVFWLVSLTDRNKDFPESLVPVRTIRPKMFEAFDLGVSMGLDVVSRHIPRCMLPGYWDHVWDVRTDNVYIVTPESRFWLRDSRITANTFVAKCEACHLKPRCMGIRRDYLDAMGDEEVLPVLFDTARPDG